MTVKLEFLPKPGRIEIARRRFIAVAASRALVGAALATAFVFLAGTPDFAEKVAIAGLVAPALLAVLALTTIRLEILEMAGLAHFALLIAYLSMLTGGLGSPLILWLPLIPAEAALAGGRPTVSRAGGAAALALIAVFAIQWGGFLPPSRLPLPATEVFAFSILAAVMQAALIAAAAQDRQRIANRAAEEGAAMYRFLADNAMDLITRHGADGRIRFASPASLALLAYAPDDLIGV